MVEVNVNDKQKYLTENYPFVDIPNLSDLKECIHCGNIITVGDFKIFKDEVCEEYICCPNAPDCDGTVIDWLDLQHKS